MENEPNTHYYYSNRWQQLADHLGSSLFHNTSAPFSKKLVLLGNPTLSEELVHYWIQKNYSKVILGIHFKEVTSGLFFLLSQLSSSFDARFPPPLALSFLVEILLMQELKNPLYKKIATYISHGSSDRIVGLAKQLTHEFTDYMRYGLGEIESWKEKEGWKQHLWHRVFEHVSPLNELLKTELDFALCDVKEIFVFGVPHLPEVFKKALEKLSQGLEVHYYFQTPTPFFLGDWKTKQEQYHYLKHVRKQAHRTELLEHFHSQDLFLSELSTLIRSTQEWLETFTHHQDLFEFRSSPRSTLECIQSQLAGYGGFSDSPQDDSIQILACESKTQEVECLYETLCRLLESSNLNPRDCLVLVSNLEEYLSCIEWVFCAKKAQIPIRIEGKPAVLEQRLAYSFIKWLELMEGRFEISKVMDFLKIPFVRERWGFAKEDLISLEILLKKVGVRWGLNAQQRCLIDAFQEETSFESSWEDGFRRLAYACVYPKGELSQAENSCWSPLELSAQEMQQIESLYAFIQQLLQDWNFLQTEKRSCIEWKEWIENVLYTYFPLGSETKDFIHSIQSVMEFPLNNALISYSSFMHRMKEMIERGVLSWGMERNAVRFIPYQIGRSYQAKVLVLLGMDETKVPRKETQKLSRDLHLAHIPSSAAEDRHAFLEAILNAENHFIMSYSSHVEKESQKVEKSRLIQWMMTCFQLQEIEASANQEWAFYHPHKHLCEDPKPAVAVNSVAALEDRIYLTTSLLKQLLVSPLRFFFQYHHRLYPFSEEVSAPFSDIYPSALTRHQLRVMGLHNPMGALIEAAKKQGMAPEGVFEELTWNELRKELKEAKQFLGDRISLDDFFDVFLHRESTQSWVKEQHRYTPALEMKIGQNQVVIEGKIGPLYEEGVVCFSKNTLSTRLKLYPDVLLAHSLELVKPKVFFPREKSIWEPPLIPLQTLLEFALNALKVPLPLFPEQVESFLKKKGKKMEEPKDAFYALSHSLLKGKKIEDVLLAHQPKLEMIYSPFLEEKKKRK